MCLTGENTQTLAYLCFQRLTSRMEYIFQLRCVFEYIIFCPSLSSSLLRSVFVFLRISRLAYLSSASSATLMASEAQRLFAVSQVSLLNIREHFTLMSPKSK